MDVNGDLAPDDEHLRKFYPLEMLADRPFALGCVDILAQALSRSIELWLAVRRLGPRPKMAGEPRITRFLADIELGGVLKVLSPQTAADLRVYAVLGRAAEGRTPFSLSAPRIRLQIDAISPLAGLDAIAADEGRQDLTARIIRLNLGSGRHRLRLAARSLDHELTFVAERARETATYRFGALDETAGRQVTGLDERETAYRDELSSLEALAIESLELSRRASDRPSETSRVYWSSVLFTRLCNGLVSLLRVLPGSSYSSVHVDHIWDFGAVANATRSIVECMMFHHYLCIEPIEVDEWAARQNLMYLHDATSRLRIFYADDQSSAEATFYSQQRGVLISRLQASSYFSGLSERQRSRFLKGRDAAFLSQDEILTRIGIDSLASFRAYYEFISSHVHSLPVAFLSVLQEEPEQRRGRGVENRAEKAFMVRAMGFVQWVMKLAHEHFISVQSPLLPPDTSTQERPERILGTERSLGHDPGSVESER